ncbi:MAG TPA: glycosyltransferase [Thermoanaerobaculia bacterium]
MRIAQIVLPDASAYERKSQRVDHAALSVAHQVILTSVEEIAAARADVAHVYGPRVLPSSLFRRFPVPYVATGDIPWSRWPFGKPVEPDYVVSPLIEKVEQSRLQPLPEAVEDAYFMWDRHSCLSGAGGQTGVSVLHDLRGQTGVSVPHFTLGTYARPSVINAVEQTIARIERFRDDITWNLYQHPPTPADLAGVDLWVDPATDATDLDGFVAEAIVMQVPVVASRTPINELRLEQGRTGFLVPARDPNELTHAILTALFKSEVAQRKIEAAGQTFSKFRARQRLRILSHMYETLIS